MRRSRRRPLLRSHPRRRTINLLTPLERVAVAAAAETAATQQGSLAPLFANLGVARRVERPAAAAAAGGAAGAGAADQPRSESDRQRHPKRLPEIRAVSRGFAGVGIGFAIASGIPDLKAALIVLRQTLLSSLGASESRRRRRRRSRRGGAPLPRRVSRRLRRARRRQPSKRRRWRPSAAESRAARKSCCRRRASPVADETCRMPDKRRPARAPRGLARRRAALGDGGHGRSTAAGGAAGNSAGQPATQCIGNGHACRMDRQRRRSDRPHQHAAAAISRRAAVGASRSPRRRSHPMRRLRQPRIICSTIPMPRSRARPCCRWRRCRIASTPATRGSIRPRRAGISKFRLRRRRARRWRSSKSRATAAATRSKPPKRVWRARFSLDVEPAGPVHALVSLSGERTSVRMWAERPATAAQLRAGAPSSARR